MFRSKVISFFLVLISVLGSSAQIVWPKPQFNGRYIGDATNIKEAPFQVSIELSFVHICTGNIIRDDLILTAGQCVWEKSEQDLRVRVGTDTYGVGGEVYQAKEVTVHEDYDNRTKNFDFALIQLQNKIVPNDKKAPVVVSSEGPSVDSAVTAYGWNRYLRNVQKVNAKIIDGVDCSNIYERYGGITENMICAKIDISTNRFACGGDVGAGLVSQGSEGVVLEGVTSWGSGCSRPSNPVVYSRVSAVSDWIQSNAVEN